MLFKSNTYQINKQAIQFLEMIKNTNQNYVSEEQFRHLLGLILQSGCYTIDRKNKEDIDFLSGEKTSIISLILTNSYDSIFYLFNLE